MSNTKKTEVDIAALRELIAQKVLVKASDGAVIIGEESSGLQQKWIFDFRAVMLQSDALSRYAEIFWHEHEKELPFQVGAMESAGIPFVAAVVMKGAERGHRVNGFFIRKSRKRQGLMKQIEGNLTQEPVILLDDLVNSGNTLDKQIKILQDQGVPVKEVCTVLRFKPLDYYEKFTRVGIVLNSLFSLEDFDLAPITSQESPQQSFEEIWRYRGPSPSLHIVVQKSAPVFDGARILFGCDDAFRALDSKTGEVVWEYPIHANSQGKAVLSSPALYKDSVIFGAYDGVVYRLNTRDGTKIWTYDDADWVGSSPCVAENIGTVFIGLEYGLWRKRGGISALSLDDGTEKWSARMPELVHGTPLYIREENMVVIGCNDSTVYAYDADKGVLLWQSAMGDVKSSFAYEPVTKSILCGSLQKGFHALRAKNGQPIFAFMGGAGMYSTPLISERHVYFSSLDKHVYAFDTISWTELWRFETSGRIFATPVKIGESIFIGSNDGRLYEIHAKTGKELRRFQTTERIVNKIAHDPITGHFFLPTNANEIYCVRRITPHE